MRSRLYAGIAAAALMFDDEDGGVAVSDTSAGLELYGGFRLRENLAVEVSYDAFDALDLHDVAGSGISRFDLMSQRRTWRISVVREISLQDLFHWQRDWRVYGSVGVYDSAVDRTKTMLGSSGQLTVSDELAGALVGAGVLYRLGNVGLRGYARWFGMLDRSEASEAGVGVQLRF